MKHTLLFLFFYSFVLVCFSQNTKYSINYFSSRDYGKGLEATNRACVQDKNGVLYFGNAGRIIQYDGTNWNYIPVKQQSAWLFSLAVSNNNIIYVGAQNEFGYLAPNASGKLNYISLSDKLDSSKKVFSKIIRVLTWNNNVAFQAEEAIYIYSNNKLFTILPNTSFHLSFVINDEFYVRQRDIGIMKLVDNKLQFIDGTEYYKNFGVFSIIPDSKKNKLIIITREDGFWLFDNKTFKSTPIITPDSIVLKQSEIYGGLKLSDGNIALNTLNNGVIIVNEKLIIQNVINKNVGLKDDGVHSVIEDFQGNLWAGLNNGIAQIHYSLPVSIYRNEDGISGNITSITKYNSKLFIGSTNGLYSLSNNISVFENFTKAVKSICKAYDNLIVGTSEGLYSINNNNIYKIDNVEVNSIYYSNKLKMLFVSSKNGLLLYNKNLTWKKVAEIKDIFEEIVRFEEDTTKNYSEIWMGTLLQGVIRIQYVNKAEYKIDKYNSLDGLVDNAWVLPFKINNKMVFSQRNGLLQFVDEETIKSQLPDSLKNNPEFYRGYFDLYKLNNKILNSFYYVIEDSKDKVYANLDGDIGFFDKANSYTWNTNPFCIADIGKANVFYHEDNGVCWIGGDDGLLKFDENKSKNYSINFKTIITKVSCGSNDSLLYSGYGSCSIKSNNIDYNFNTINFSFAAPFYEGQDKTQYSYMLVGQDTAYSLWNKENHVVFTNLWEGNYVFKVRAKNIYGVISSESSFGFTIESPWYRKYWAYLIYFIVLIVIVYLIVRLNSNRLIAKNKKLEKIILERTHEIHEKNIELQTQKEEILDSINYARRIQKAVLPDDDLTINWLGNHFVIFKPKDIVSGDFYWATQITTMGHAPLTTRGLAWGVKSVKFIFLKLMIINELENNGKI